MTRNVTAGYYPTRPQILPLADGGEILTAEIAAAIVRRGDTYVKLDDVNYAPAEPRSERVAATWRHRGAFRPVPVDSVSIDDLPGGLAGARQSVYIWLPGEPEIRRGPYRANDPVQIAMGREAG